MKYFSNYVNYTFMNKIASNNYVKVYIPDAKLLFTYVLTLKYSKQFL